MNLTINLEFILLIGLIIAFIKIKSLQNLILKQNEILRKYMEPKAVQELYELELKKPNYSMTSKNSKLFFGVLSLAILALITMVIIKLNY